MEGNRVFERETDCLVPDPWVFERETDCLVPDPWVLEEPRDLLPIASLISQEGLQGAGVGNAPENSADNHGVFHVEGIN